VVLCYIDLIDLIDLIDRIAFRESLGGPIYYIDLIDRIAFSDPGPVQWSFAT
jgi:hypothetical protein